ncbi:MAG: ATP-dependent helicase [Anaerolineales bacterium]|nr:ATP-dependent helicase [Anaerolineales bacterium]
MSIPTSNIQTAPGCAAIHWPNDLALEPLSPEQRAVVLAAPDHAIRLLAGPGTGRTRVIAGRYASLVAAGLPPANIVVVTRSRPLALELRARITALFPADWQSAHGPALAQITTIAALCRRLLVLSDAGHRRPAKPWQTEQIVRDLARHCPAISGSPYSVPVIQDMLRRARADGVREDQAGAFFRTMKAMSANLADGLAQVYADYSRRMWEAQLFTADALIGEVEIRLKEEAAFRERWQAQIRYIFLDEAQDATPQTLRILAALAVPHDGILVAGDPDQRLGYSSESAPPPNGLVEFERLFPEGRTERLSVNFRSTRQIVAFSQRLINHHDSDNPDDSGPLDRFRITLTPRPDAPEGEAISFQWLETVEDEARVVADQIEALLCAGRRPGDILIGARTRAQLAYVEDELVGRDLPIVNLNSRSFWLRGHIRHLIDHLALALDHSDRPAFRRIYNIPSRRIVDRRLDQKFLAACGGQWAGIPRAVSRPAGRRWRAGAVDLVRWLKAISQQAQAGPPAAVLQFVLDSGYWDHLCETIDLAPDEPADDPPAEGEAEIEVLLQFARRFDTCQALVAYARQRERLAARTGNRLAESIVLATIHQLTSHERAVVFGLGWCEGGLPHSSSLADGAPRALAAERRLAYRLVTRAKDLCRLSGPARHVLTGQALLPSRFAEEMGLRPAMTVGKYPTRRLVH